MTPELVKALTDAGIAMTVVMLSAFVGVRLLSTLFSFVGSQNKGSNQAWSESVELLQQAWTENSRLVQEQTAAIRDLRNEIKEDRRFWTQQITQSMEIVLREIRQEAYKGAATGAKQGVSDSSQNVKVK